MPVQLPSCLPDACAPACVQARRLPELPSSCCGRSLAHHSLTCLRILAPRMHAQEAWLLAELSAVRAEVGRLKQELQGRHRAEAALQDQWRRCGACCQVVQLEWLRRCCCDGRVTG